MIIYKISNLKLNFGYLQTVIEIIVKDTQQQAPLEITSNNIQTQRCNKKCCNVGRNCKKKTSLFFPKINLIDFSKIQPRRNMKMCMKTKLIDGAHGGDSDYMPLLITSTDDLVLPLNAEESGDSGYGNGKSNICFTKRLNRETFARFLDTLTRTFCLPLLG